MKPKNEILLIPQFEPFQPYLSLPYIKSLLINLNENCSINDLNINFYDWLLEKVGHSIFERVLLTSNNKYLKTQINNAVSNLRSKTLSLYKYRFEINVVEEYLGSVFPKGPKIGLTHLKVANRYSSSDLKKYLKKPDNIFKSYFECTKKDILGAKKVSQYLFSFVVIDQLPAAVAFAQEIKKHRPNAKIYIGGPMASRIHKQLKSVPWIANSFDGIFPGEAINILPKIFGQKQVYKGHVTPDFSELDLDQYLSCRRVLPYLVSHGCKWGKCAFCTHHSPYEGYRTSHIRDVINDLEYLSQRYDAQYFSFSDEYLTATQLDQLADVILERGLNIRWSTFARAEPKFKDHDYTGKLYAAGCRMLMFGFESASQRVLNLMKKGTNVKDYAPIFRSCRDANIAVRSDFLVGFPGEKEEDFEQTWSFVVENKELLDTPFSSNAVAVFELRDGSYVHQHANEFGITPRHRLRGDLDDQFYFDGEGVASESQRIEWRERLIRFFKTECKAELICPQNKTHQLIFKSLYDSGELELPVLEINQEELQNLKANLAEGVHLAKRHSKLRVSNYANGGEIEVDKNLSQLFHHFAEGVNLEKAYRLQKVLDRGKFVKLIDFLYRNEYIWISTKSKKNEMAQ